MQSSLSLDYDFPVPSALGARRGYSRAPSTTASGQRAKYSPIVIAKLNEADPHAWLADVLARITDHPASRLDEWLPRHWPRHSEDRSLAA